MTKVIGCMSRDTCNEVRLSTVNGIIYLLENPQGYEIMKVLLPRLCFMFSDPTLSAWIAVTDLILPIRDIQTFQFNKVWLLNCVCKFTCFTYLHLIPKEFLSLMQVTTEYGVDCSLLALLFIKFFGLISGGGFRCLAVFPCKWITHVFPKELLGY